MGKVFKISDRAAFEYKPSTKACTHNAVTIDEDTRTVECKDCEAVLDPFDFLVKCAYNEAHTFKRYEQLEKAIEARRREEKRLNEQIERLKRIKKLKQL